MFGIHNIFAWNERWRVVGTIVHCRHCGATQAEDARNQQFVHADRCRCPQSSAPWHDLEIAAYQLNRYSQSGDLGGVEPKRRSGYQLDN